jgi:hypothetical protein
MRISGAEVAALQSKLGPSAWTGNEINHAESQITTSESIERCLVFVTGVAPSEPYRRQRIVGDVHNFRGNPKRVARRMS